jgi:hypothetical protein
MASQSVPHLQEEIMNTILKTAALVSVLCLSACAYPQKGMTPQQAAFKSAQNECTALTNSMIGGTRYNWYNDLEWSSYFEWCMENKGYTKEQLKTIWY